MFTHHTIPNERGWLLPAGSEHIDINVDFETVHRSNGSATDDNIMSFDSKSFKLLHEKNEMCHRKLIENFRQWRTEQWALHAMKLKNEKIYIYNEGACAVISFRGKLCDDDNKVLASELQFGTKVEGTMKMDFFFHFG